MANSGAKLFLLSFTLLNLSVETGFASIRTIANGQDIHVHQMVQENNSENSHSLQKRSLRHKRSSGDERCQDQKDKFLDKLKIPDKKEAFLHSYQFLNESKYSMSLAWAGPGANDKKLLVSTTEEQFIFAKPSTLYQSVNNGKNFTNITSRIPGCQIRKDNGLQKHPNREGVVYIICHSHAASKSALWQTVNGGDQFNKVSLDFVLDGALMYHPLPEKYNYILTRTITQKKLYLTTDGGLTWKKVKDDVQNVKWTTWDANQKADPYQTIYVSVEPNPLSQADGDPSSHFDLMKSTDMGNTWTTIHTDIYTFGMEGEFLFASIHRPDLSDAERLMEVSTTGGKDWAEVQLPTITEDRFYSILDSSEGLIFLHVDNPGDTGHGTLYTSDKTGIIFSESLERHLYPNYQDLTDFYKVKSMKGVYIASQLMADNSIRTVITYDRGGEWRPVTRPVNAPCKDETKQCFLQIHNMFSMSKGVAAQPPLSYEGAPGLLLVHGHVADALQTSDPDVYISSDGGYSWRLALNGPHHYQIADQGGLIVAVPADTSTPQVIKFSTDEGVCWHNYTFTSEPIMFTGVLTEPGNKEMTVAIWGYGKTDRSWRVQVIDFTQIIENDCQENDYVDWTPHSLNNKDGCLLGRQETLAKLKPDSWCKNGHARDLTNTKVKTCECTEADYDCDYSYYRPVGKTQCRRDPKFKGKVLDICERGHEEQLVVAGYHKIPGDVCDGGWTPPGGKDKLVDLHKRCVEGDKSFVEEEIGYSAHEDQGRHYSKGQTAVIAAVVIVTLLALLILVAYFVRKLNLIGARNARFRYSTLATADNEPSETDPLGADIERALGTHTSLYEDSSDEELPKHATSQANGRAGGLANGGMSSSSPARIQPSEQSTGNTPNLRGYHDDSDDDLLQ